MSVRLAALRRSLDLMPSPVEDRPGLLLRDPFGYTNQVVIVPPPLVPFLRLFDGEHDEHDLAAALYRATGDLEAPAFARRLAEALAGNGFLENEELERRRAERHRAFAEAARREPAHAGTAYPDDPGALRSLLDSWLGRQGDEPAPPADVFAVAAPHVSPDGGQRSYAAAYRALPRDGGDRTFVVLGTSHYGAAGRFGLTYKRYLTPLGAASTDTPLVERLVATGGDALVLEDYCHAVEHSIEFQVLFLQHLFGPQVRVLPVLCGPLDAVGGRLPEEEPSVGRFFGALAEMQASEGRRLSWVLAVDMAHVGHRYGSRLAARVGSEALREVERRDRQRIAALEAGDAGAFWTSVGSARDDLNWCGASALYTFLRAASPGRGALLRYEQWNIDPASVVSFAALAFGRNASTPAGEGGA